MLQPSSKIVMSLFLLSGYIATDKTFLGIFHLRPYPRVPFKLKD